MFSVKMCLRRAVLSSPFQGTQAMAFKWFLSLSFTLSRNIKCHSNAAYMGPPPRRANSVCIDHFQFPSWYSLWEALPLHTVFVCIAVGWPQIYSCQCRKNIGILDKYSGTSCSNNTNNRFNGFPKLNCSSVKFNTTTNIKKIIHGLALKLQLY